MTSTTTVVSLHDVTNLQSFIGICMGDAIRKYGCRLTHHQREDAHSFLLEMVLREHTKWNPETIPDFSHWVRVAVSRRFVDWLRKELGDSRYKSKRPQSIPLGEWIEEIPEADFSDEADTTMSIHAAFAKLSDEGKWTLENLARPVSEQTSLVELARQQGKSKRWVRDQLDLLRDELIEQGITLSVCA